MDFSDRLRGGKQRLGYVCWSGELELAGQGEQETPLQKYQRLNCEVRELQEELASAKDASESEQGDKKALSSVAVKVTSLQDELSKLKLEEALGSHLLKDLKDPQGSANAKLLSHLDQLKATKGDSKSAPDSAGDGKQVTYELLMRPEDSKLATQEKIAAFDKRLEGIEKALGIKNDGMSNLSLETSNKSIFETIDLLSARQALFEPNHLDHIEGRLAALQQKMNAVAEKKSALENHEINGKVGELYDMVQRSEVMAQVLPDVVDRLESLEGLHEQALQFSKALAHLETVQKKLEGDLSTNNEILNVTKEKFAGNIVSIQENFQVVEDRIKKIQK